MLYSDLKDLGNLIHIKLRGKKKTTSVSESSSKSSSKSSSLKSLSSKKSSSSKSLPAQKPDKASGINNNKTRKYRGERSSISFKRKPPPKRFKNPVFLSIK
jgi:hypothetical protein